MFYSILHFTISTGTNWNHDIVTRQENCLNCYFRNVDRPLTTSLGINSTKVERETDRDRRWWFEETLNKHAATQRQSINQSSFITSNSATIHSALQTLRDITTLVDNGRSRSRICTSSKTLSLSCMRSSLWEAALCIVCLYVRLFRFCCSKRTGYCLHSTLTLCI